jgi:hypothetical protein
MNIGDIDGKGKIYDGNGNLILKQGERLLSKKIDTECMIRKRGRLGRIGEKRVFLRGKGTLYRTNKRFVFLRMPMKLKQVASPVFGGPNIPNLVGIPVREEDKSQDENFMAYFEIYLDEISCEKIGFISKHRIETQKKDEKYIICIEETNTEIVRSYEAQQVKEKKSRVEQ